MNFSQNLKDFFLEAYGETLNKSDLFISFEPIGCMIDSYGEETDEHIARHKANEQLSILSERLPAISETLIAGTDRLSELYETLVMGARFAPNELKPEDKESYQKVFAQAKSEAIEKIENGKRSSLHTPAGIYYEVTGTPEKWYDEKAPIWNYKKFVITDTAQDTTSSNKFKPILFDLKWKNIENVKKEDQKIEPIFTKINLKTNYGLKKDRLSRKMLDSRIISTPKIQPTKLKDHQQVALSNIDLNKITQINKSFDFASRATTISKLLQNKQLKEQKAEANNVNISFDYCLVNLKREWFDKSLIYYSNLWYSLGMQKDFFSNGIKDETNEGNLKCVSVAMILIKNLKVKATWNGTDIANSNNSISLGMFNISNNTISTENEITNSGIQAVGWICEVLPKLPCHNDPYFKD